MKLVILLLLSASPCFGAASKYLWSGASGSGTGDDWANAYTSVATFESNLGRASTNYVAEGTYGNVNFNVSASGSQLIVIRKATTNDHGTATGWSDSMADGQVQFDSTIQFNSDNWVLDGMYRNELDWGDSNSYGFYVGHNNQFGNFVVNGNNIVIARVFVGALLGDFSGVDERRYGFDCDSFGGPIWTGLRFSSNAVWGSNNTWFLRTTDGAIVEYSWNYGVGGNAANHGENVNLYFTADNAIIRFNHFKDSFLSGLGGSGGTAVIAIQGGGNGGKIYGNLFDTYQVGDAAIGFGVGSGDGSNYEVYNNTFVNSTTGAGGIGFQAGSGNTIRNNLFVNVVAPGINGGSGSTVTHNAFSNSSGSGSNMQLNVPTSIFINFANNDFRLSANTSAGFTLSAPYDVDRTGTAYDASGTWSRGAFAFVAQGGGGPSVPTLPIAAGQARGGRAF